MRLAAITLSLFPLVVIELALRVTEPSAAEAIDTDPLVDLDQLRPLFVLDDQSRRWEIPPERFNFFRPSSFVDDKPEDLRRIFVLGGSTVQGRPYATETAFPMWLKLQLEAATPEGEFEVVNCGGVSYASYRVARIMEEVLQHEPDAVVLYIGHNEFLEHREYAEVRQMGRPRRWLSTLASKLRVVKWLQARFVALPSPRTVLAGEVDAQLDHEGGLNRYVRDPSWKSGVENHFRQTLEGLIRLASAADVPLLLCVPASDLVNTPPFKMTSIFQHDSPDRKRFDASWAEATDGKLSVEQRLLACDDCLAMDPHHAGANFVAGRLRYDRGELPGARQKLVTARDFDVCPLRATSPIAAAVVELANQYGVPLLDTQRLLDQRDHLGQRSPDGIVDPEFFIDHVHPAVEGHQLIGRELFAKITALGWGEASPQQEQRYERLAQQHLDALGEDYYARGRQRLEGLRRWAAGRAAEKITLTEP